MELLTNNSSQDAPKRRYRYSPTRAMMNTGHDRGTMPYKAGRSAMCEDFYPEWEWPKDNTAKDGVTRYAVHAPEGAPPDPPEEFGD